jgi:hypothetical protein
MSTTAEYVIDKSTWGPGPWQDEPDRVDFVHAGLPCLALRHPNHGSWCGYAAVRPGHPLHGRDWREHDLPLEFHWQVCHVPAPGEPDGVWWFGGDFSHFRDFCPGDESHLAQLYEAARAKGSDAAFALRPRGENDMLFRQVYRNLPYVRAQIERLAEQLAAIAKGAA